MTESPKKSARRCASGYGTMMLVVTAGQETKDGRNQVREYIVEKSLRKLK